METLSRSILVSLLLAFAAPSYSESLEAIQTFRCEFNDETTSEDDVLEVAAAWLEAAKQTKGGANIRLVVRFPIAVGLGDVGDFTWVISMPTFTEWGEFTDAYSGSPVSKVDDQLFGDLADCGHSAMWEGILLE